jgi:hypothetical protein
MLWKYRIGVVVQEKGNQYAMGKFGHVAGFVRTGHWGTHIRVNWEDGSTTVVSPDDAILEEDNR